MPLPGWKRSSCVRGNFQRDRRRGIYLFISKINTLNKLPDRASIPRRAPLLSFGSVSGRGGEARADRRQMTERVRGGASPSFQTDPARFESF